MDHFTKNDPLFVDRVERKDTKIQENDSEVV